jgi:sterol desaturase/sphingolipid hydroxylase (fatty acid hydroxylase superfamily)
MEELGGRLLFGAVAGSAFRSTTFLVLAFLLFVPLQHFFPADRARRRRGGRWADTVHTWLNPVVIGTAAFLVVGLVDVGLRAVAGELGLRTELAAYRRLLEGLPGWAHFLAATGLSALCGYWIHRALHEWPPLWRLHAIHHSSDPVDWLSAHRQHPLEVLLIVVATAGPPALLGLSPPALLAFAMFRRLHLAFHVSVHRSPLRDPLRPGRLSAAHGYEHIRAGRVAPAVDPPAAPDGAARSGRRGNFGPARAIHYTSGSHLIDACWRTRMIGKLLGGLTGGGKEGGLGSTVGGIAGAVFGGPIGSMIGSALGGVVDKVLKGDGKQQCKDECDKAGANPLDGMAKMLDPAGLTKGILGALGG